MYRHRTDRAILSFLATSFLLVGRVLMIVQWRDRAGSDILNDYILANLPAELRKRNTTRGWRDLVRKCPTLC